MINLKPIFDLNDNDPQTLIKHFYTLPSTANTGARVTYVSEALDHVAITIPLNEQTQNMMGIVYGGIMYSATDAVYLTMLWYRLGLDYMLVDKCADVQYLRPGLGDLSVDFHLPEETVQSIIAELKEKKSTLREFVINIKDNKQKTVCKITKSIYIRKARK
ncbi:MAG: hypothetical protein CR975_07000 [Gammaproteobacteria bacterium]|nr:MAG: hypothetical protein CR975_07000 [Gammaproteobacteria bacterium]